MTTIRIDDVQVGERDRGDLGDIAGLAASIKAVGLLHPVVVTEASELVAGERRLAAVRELGWHEVPVTVVDLATAAEVLQAEADENTCRKPLTPYEASRARERRARVLAPKIQENKGGRPTGNGETSAKLAEVSKPAAARETRKVAATGTGYSGSTLDKVDRIRDVAERGIVRQGKAEVPAPAPVREAAREVLEDVKKTGAAVDRAVKSVDAAISRHLPPDPDEQNRAWRRNYLAALSAARKPLQFRVDEVAERADAECLDELARFVADLNKYHSDVNASGADAVVIQIGERR